MARRKEDPRRKKLTPLLLFQDKSAGMLHFEVRTPKRGLLWYYAKRVRGKIKLSPRQDGFFMNEEEYGDLVEAATYAFIQMDIGLLPLSTVPAKTLPLPEHNNGQQKLAFDDPQSA